MGMDKKAIREAAQAATDALNAIEDYTRRARNEFLTVRIHDGAEPFSVEDICALATSAEKHLAEWRRLRAAE